MKTGEMKEKAKQEKEKSEKEKENKKFHEKEGLGGEEEREYSYAPQYRTSRDQQISSVIGGFSLLPI